MWIFINDVEDLKANRNAIIEKINNIAKDGYLKEVMVEMLNGVNSGKYEGMELNDIVSDACKEVGCYSINKVTGRFEELQERARRNQMKALY